MLLIYWLVIMHIPSQALNIVVKNERFIGKEEEKEKWHEYEIIKVINTFQMVYERVIKYRPW